MDYMTFCNALHDTCTMARHYCNQCSFFKDAYAKNAIPFCVQTPSEWTAHDIELFVQWVREHFTAHTYEEILKEKFPEADLSQFYGCVSTIFGSEASLCKSDPFNCMVGKCAECWQRTAPLKYQKKYK